MSVIERPPARARFPFSRFEAIVGAAAFVAAAVAVWLTVRADFLAHPGWLAAQKADVILGPVLTGLYWRRRRPRSRFWPWLIAVGLVSAPVHPAVVRRAVGLQRRRDLGGRDLHRDAGADPRVPDRAARRARSSGCCSPPGSSRPSCSSSSSMVAPVIGPDRLDLGVPGGVPGERAPGLGERPARPPAARCHPRHHRRQRARDDRADRSPASLSGTPPRRRALAIGAPIAVFFLVTQVALPGPRT